MLSYYYYGQSKIHQYKKDWKKTAYFLEKSLGKSSVKNPKANYLLGFAYSKLKKWDDAVVQLQHAVKSSPEIYRWQFRYAIALENTGNKDAARDIFLSVLDYLHSDANSLYKAGLLLEGFTRPAMAEMFFKRSIELEKNKYQYYKSLAKSQHIQKKWWQELESLEKAASLNFTDAELYSWLGFAYEKMTSYDKAIIALNTATKLNPDKADWIYRLGFSYEKLGDKENALASYNKALKLSNNKEIKKYGAAVLHQKRGLWPETVSALESISKGKDAAYNYTLGLAYDRSYQWKKAFLAYQKANLAKPGDSASYFRTAFVLEKDHRYADAAKHYEMSARSSAKLNKHIFYRLGYTLHKTGLHDKACYAFMMIEDNIDISKKDLSHKNFSSNPWTAEEFYQRAVDFELLNEFTMAEQYYMAAIERTNSHKASWFFRLGCVRTKLKNYNDACEAFVEYKILTKPYGVPLDEYESNANFKLQTTYLEYYERLKIKNDVILFESFHGASISCNPYAIFKNIYNHKNFRSFKFVWVIGKDTKIPDVIKRKKNVIIIQRESNAYLRYLCSAKYVINNVSFPLYYIRKHDQKYLNTWHGTPMKFLGKDIKDSYLSHTNVSRNFLQATHIISQNDYTNEIILDRYDVSNLTSAIVSATGYPRVDLTLNATSSEISAIRRKLNVPTDSKLVLYAPTWRGLHGKASFNTKQLINDLTKMSRPGVVVAFRGHHMIENIIADLSLPAVIVPSSIDTNVLLSAVDILITDYSSICFDYMPLGKPVIYYMHDLEEYKNERGLYLSIDELPGVVSLNIEELDSEINNAIKSGALLSSKNNTNKFISREDGQSTKRVVDLFFLGKKPDDIMLAHDKKSLVIYAGPFFPNGIATSVINLLDHIDYDSYKVTLVVDVSSIKNHEDRQFMLSKVNYDVQIVGWDGGLILDPEEKWLANKFDVYRSFSSTEMKNLYMSAYQREFSRVLGHSIPDAVIHFEGYNKKWASLFASINNNYTKKIIYQHNDMLSENKEKYPYLEGVFNLYSAFDKVVSVSEATSILNKSNLADKYIVHEKKFVFSDNLQNPKYVLESSVESIEEEHLFNNGKFTFVNLGRLSPEKDHIKLLHAFSQLKNNRDDIQLIILGDGPLHSEISSEIISLGLSNDVYLLGRKANPFPYLLKSDCFVLSSNHEGQPMVLFEALILDKPIVATDIVGNRGVLKGEYGMLVENSIDGLFKGLTAAADKKVSVKGFDINSYQNSAMNMFYNLISH